MTRTAHGASANRRIQWAVVGGLYAATTSWLVHVALARGQDWSFDTVSYHAIYPLPILRSAASIGRTQLAAGAYFNPILDAPFALGVRHLNPRLLTALLVVAQSVVVAVIATVTARSADRYGFIPMKPLARNLCFAGIWLLAARLAIGGLASVQLGAGFGDLTSALPAALSIAVIVGWINFPRARSGNGASAVFGAAVLVGASAGLKLTNAAHAIALIVALMVVAGRCGWSRRSLLGRSAGGVVLGWLLVAGPWALRMAMRYGNPLFPLANGLFGSTWLRRPDETNLDLAATRFPVRTLGGLGMVALRVARGGTTVSELPLRDPRWLVCELCIVVALVVFVRSRRLRGAHRTGDAPGEPTSDTAALFVLAFWAASFVVWAVVFGNGRYGVLLEVLTPLMVISAVALAVGTGQGNRPAAPSRRGPTALLMLFLVITAVATAHTSFADWNHVAFARKWFDFDTTAVPDLRNAMLIAPTDLEPLNLGLVVLHPKAFSHLSAALLPTRLGQHEVERIHRFPGQRYVILGGIPATDELAAARLRVNASCWPLTARQGFAYRVCRLEIVQ